MAGRLQHVAVHARLQAVTVLTTALAHKAALAVLLSACLLLMGSLTCCSFALLLGLRTSGTMRMTYGLGGVLTAHMACQAQLVKLQ